ncbi:MAG: imidazolonepropionase [Acidobacteria bacterium]|uniref:Imidazolonepropionase n=1 Tax=Candidatus Polarisedimenticola svalbardensis TaxID=2886004 RepID=A0A8J7CDL3_9BACT|nr:imidazolonepropionase [Candidatus Polarisedimenticola svalbardensis]
MIPADLVVSGISELATPEGNTALAGPHTGRLRIIRNAAVACHEGKIVFVGEEAECIETVQPTPDCTPVDAAGGTVLPGFVDAHTHLPFAGWRETEFDERLKGATYSDIAARGGGILSTVEAVRKMDRKSLAATVRGRLNDLLAQGTTTAEAKSGYGLDPDAEIMQLEALGDAASGHPVQLATTFLGAHTVPKEYRGRRQRYIQLILDEMLPQVAKRRLATFADAFVDAHAFSVEEARLILEAAKGYGLKVRLHADQLADDGGALLAAELEAASADHLEFASDEGLEAMARAGTCGVLLPAATFFLMMDRKPPGRRLLDAGVPVVVATDFNPGTCPCESMSAATWFACLTAGLSVDEAITATTLNAAHSLGMADQVGSIEVGKRGDMVVHDFPNRYHLVYRFGIPRITAVVADGKRVV